MPVLAVDAVAATVDMFSGMSRLDVAQMLRPELDTLLSELPSLPYEVGCEREYALMNKARELGCEDFAGVVFRAVLPWANECATQRLRDLADGKNPDKEEARRLGGMLLS